MWAAKPWEIAMSFEWKNGKDGTEYYVDTANGNVAGMVKTADNGPDIYKVGFGGDFVKLYYQLGNARSAVEKMAKPTTALRGMRLPATRAKPASTKQAANKKTTKRT